jgi:YVTN family beta-propeller protein
MKARRTALVTLLFLAACTSTRGGTDRSAVARTLPSVLPVGALASPGLSPSSTRQVVAAILVGDLPEGVAVGSGAVWVANHGSGSVSRIDPGTNRVVATIPVGRGPARIVTGSGVVWVTDDKDNYLWRIDPGTNRATSIRLRGRVSGTPTIASGAVWATVWNDSTLIRIDPATNAVTTVARLKAPPIGVQFAHGSFWVASTLNEAGRISRIDATTFRTTAIISAGRLPWFQGDAVGDHAIWVADPLAGLVLEIDTRTNRVTALWRFGQVPIVAVADGLVWVNQADRTMSRIDPLTGQIVERLRIGGSIGGVAAGYGAIWLVSSNDGVVWRLDGGD